MFGDYVQSREKESFHILSRCRQEPTQSIREIGTPPFEMDDTMSSLRRISGSDFLRRFRENGAHFISSAYLMSTRGNIKTSPIDGSLCSSLPEDVFTLVETQLALVHEFLETADLSTADSGDAIVADALLSIFRILCWKQIHYGCTSLFLHDLQSCIARANDYCRMGQKTNDLMRNVSGRHYRYLAWENADEGTELPEWNTTNALVQQEASRLIDQLNADSVQASQHAAIRIIQTIEQLDIPHELFSRHWEEDLTNNEVARYIVKVCSNSLSEVNASLVSTYLYQKVVVTLVRCIICFYVKCLVLKADRMKCYYRRRTSRRKRKSFFRSPNRALLRMTHDIQLFKDFFLQISEGSTALHKIIANEFSILSQIVLESSSCALGECKRENLEQFMIVVHKRTGANLETTRRFLSDIFALMSDGNNEYYVRETVNGMKEDLERLKEIIEEREIISCERSQMKSDRAYFRLDEMLKAEYEDRVIQEKSFFCAGLERIRRR